MQLCLTSSDVVMQVKRSVPSKPIQKAKKAAPKRPVAQFKTAANKASRTGKGWLGGDNGPKGLDQWYGEPPALDC